MILCIKKNKHPVLKLCLPYFILFPVPSMLKSLKHVIQSKAVSTSESKS